jgi:hypothetical protein
MQGRASGSWSLLLQLLLLLVLAAATTITATAAATTITAATAGAAASVSRDIVTTAGGTIVSNKLTRWVLDRHFHLHTGCCRYCCFCFCYSCCHCCYSLEKPGTPTMCGDDHRDADLHVRVIDTRSATHKRVSAGKQANNSTTATS